MFSRLNETMASVVQAIDDQDNQNPGSLPGTTVGAVGAVGPLFNPQNSPSTARTTRSVGAKPTRTFVWLGPNVSDVDFSSLNEKKIKFEKSMNAEAMVTLLKREFPAITASRISYYKSRSAGNHALYHVGDALSGEEIANTYRSCTTRVFVADRQAVPAEPAVPAVLPARGVPPAPAAVINATVSTGNSTGHSTDKAPKECIKGHLGPQYHETGFPVGVIAPDYYDDGLYHPGLLHASRLQIIDTALKGSKSSGLPYVGITFECLCHHINSGPRVALVILTNHTKHLTVGESEMLSVLCELYCNEKMSYNPDPLIWIQSRDSEEGIEAIQTIGGQSLGYPQLVICTPSLRGVKAPLIVEKFTENFMSIDFVDAMAKAQEAVQVVQVNRMKRNEDLALKRQQDEEYLMTVKADASKDKKRNSVQPSLVIDIDKTIDEPAIHEIGDDLLHHGNNSKKEKQIRKTRALRVQPEVEGGVEIRILSPLGMLRKTFSKKGFYQEVYDWLGSKENLPLYFLLQHQATDRVAYPKDNIETQRHVLRLVEKDEKEMKKIMCGEEVTFRGTMPRSPKQNSMVGSLGAKTSVAKEGKKKEHRKIKRREGERKDNRKEKRKEGDTKEDRKKKRQEAESNEGGKEKRQEGKRKKDGKEKRQEEARKEEMKEDSKEKRQGGEMKERKQEREMKVDRKDKEKKKTKQDEGTRPQEAEEIKGAEEIKMAGEMDEGGERSALTRRKRRRQKEKDRKRKQLKT